MQDTNTTPESLRLFEPEPADGMLGNPQRPLGELVPYDAAGVFADAIGSEPVDAWNLSRAMRVSGVRDIYGSDPAFVDEEWYGRMGSISAVEPFGLIKGEYVPLARIDPEPPGQPVVRPERIAIHCTVEQGGTTETRRIETDVAFIGDPASLPNDTAVFVADGAGISVDDLAALMESALFSPWDDREAESRATQLEDFRTEAQARAMKLLVSEEAALMVHLRSIARPLPWILRGRGGVIRIPADGSESAIEIGTPA